MFVADCDLATADESLHLFGCYFLVWVFVGWFVFGCGVAGGSLGLGFGTPTTRGALKLMNDGRRTTDDGRRTTDLRRRHDTNRAPYLCH